MKVIENSVGRKGLSSGMQEITHTMFSTVAKLAFIS